MGHDHLSNDEAAEVGRVADAFEAAWKQGGRPDIAKVLVGASHEARGAALIELVCLDFEYRRKHGETCSMQDYVRRFPELADTSGRPIPELISFAQRISTSLDDTCEVTATIEESTEDAAQARLIETVRPAHPPHARVVPSPPPAESAVSKEVPTAFPRIDGYHIIAKLGQGGMGAVYRATQLATRREVALKLMAGRALGSEKARRRFEREVELASSLEHPHIARVFDSGLARQVYFYAMQLVPGVPLDKHVEMNQLDEKAILEVFLKVCRAVEFAHRKGVIHRDLKPSNVMVTQEGDPFVLDFGLAKTLLDDGEHLTVSQEGDLTGTPAYMSPEQAAGHVRSIDTRTDVYALGVILFRLLTNNHPHDLTGSAFDLTKRIIELDPKRPRNIKANLDRDLEAILLKCLEKSPANRYGSAGGLAEDIEKYLRREPISAQPATATYFLKKKLARHKPLVALAATLFIVFNAAVGFYFWSIKAEQARTETARQEAISAEKQAEADRDKAKDEALRASKAEAAANTERDRASRETEAANRELYFNKIGLVYRLLREGDQTQAQLLLSQCPQHLRNWEWRFLTHLSTFAESHLDGLDSTPVWCDSTFNPPRLAGAGKDGKLVLWDATTLKILRRLEHPGSSAASVCLSKDGTLIASSDRKGVLCVWDCNTGIQKLTRDGHRADFGSMGMAFSPDARFLAVPLQEPTVRVYDTKDWTSKDFKWSKRSIDQAAFHPNSKLLAATGLDGVIVWDIETGNEVHRHEISGGAGAISFNAKGDLLASGGQSGVTVHRIANNRFTPVDFADSSPAHCIQFSPDDSSLAAVGYFGYLRIWDIKSGRRRFAEHIGQSPTMTFLPSGRIVYGSFATRLTARDWTDDAQMLQISGIRHEAAAFDQSATRLFVAPPIPPLSTQSRLTRWSVVPLTNDVGSSIHINVSHDGKISVLSGERTTYARSDGGKVVEISSPATTGHRGMDAAGRYLAIGCNDGKAYVYRTDTGAMVRTVACDDRVPPAVAISNNGKLLATTVYATAQVQVHDIESGERIWASRHRGADHKMLKFSPDGRLLFSATRNGVVHAWSMKGPNPQFSLTGCNDVVNDVAVSHDGSRILTQSNDGTMRIWEAQSGREILVVDLGRGKPRRMQLLDDDKVLAITTEASTSRDFHLRVWDMRVGGSSDLRPQGDGKLLTLGETINLLSLVAPARDVLDNAPCSKDADALILGPAINARVRLPVQVEGAYRVTLEFERKDGIQGLGLILPVQSRQCMVEVDGFPQFGHLTGLDRIAGKRLDVQPDVRKGPLITDNRKHTIEVTVTPLVNQVTVVGKLDGQTIVNWSGPFSALSLYPAIGLNDHRALGVMAFDTKIRVTKLELTLLEGTGVLTHAQTKSVAVAAPGREYDLREMILSDAGTAAPAGQVNDLVVSDNSTDTKHSCIRAALPLRGSYELTGEFERLSQSGLVAILLPVGQWQAAFYLDHPLVKGSGVDKVDGRGFESANGFLKGHKIESMKRYAMRITVQIKADEAQITAYLDGQRLTEWRGAANRLSLSPSWTAVGDQVGIGAWRGQVRWHSLKLKPLDDRTLIMPASRSQVPSEVVKPGEAVDLLANLSLEEDLIGGNLTRLPNGVQIASTSTCRLMTRVQPRGGYELSLTLSRETGDKVAGVVLPVGDRRCAMLFDVEAGSGGRTAPFSSGIETIAGKVIAAKEHPATVIGQALFQGKQHVVLIRVEPKDDEVSVDVQLDGKAYLNWKGKQSDLDVWPSWRVPRSGVFVLGCEKGSVNFHAATLKMLDGEAWLRPAEKTEAIVKPAGVGD